MGKIIKAIISIILIGTIVWIYYAYNNIDKVTYYRDSKNVNQNININNLEIINDNNKDKINNNESIMNDIFIQNKIENDNLNIISNNVENNLENNLENKLENKLENNILR